jgi:hypothetical protein
MKMPKEESKQLNQDFVRFVRDDIRGIFGRKRE